MPKLSPEQLKELFYSHTCHGEVKAQALLHSMTGSCTQSEYDDAIEDAMKLKDIVEDLPARALAKWPRTDLAGVDTHTPSHFFVETFPRVEPGAEEQMEEAFWGYLVRVKAPAFVAAVWWDVCAPKGSIAIDPDATHRDSDAGHASVASPHWLGKTPPASEQTSAIQESIAWLIAHYKLCENPDEEQMAMAARADLRAEKAAAYLDWHKLKTRGARARLDAIEAQLRKSVERSTPETKLK